VGQLPTGTELTLANTQHFHLRAENTTEYALDTRAHSLRGQISQLDLHHSNTAQLSGLLALNWASPPAEPISLSAQAEAHITREIIQLDINGASPEGDQQWDVHSSLDSTRDQLHVNRLFVQKAHTRQAKRTHQALRAAIPAFSRIIGNVPETKQIADPANNKALVPFSHIALSTTATLPLPPINHPNTQWFDPSAKTTKRPQNKRYDFLTALQLTPWPILTTADLLFSPSRQVLVQADWQQSAHPIKIEAKLEQLKTSWLLSALGVTACEATGAGQFSVVHTPLSETPSQALRFFQSSSGRLSCQAHSNLSGQLQANTPLSSRGLVLPFDTLQITQLAQPKNPRPHKPKMVLTHQAKKAVFALP
jgi:hypothetical protein